MSPEKYLSDQRIQRYQLADEGKNNLRYLFRQRISN